MIVDLDTRLWSRSDDLGDELGVAVRRSASTRWLAPDASPEAYTGAMATVDAAMLVDSAATSFAGRCLKLHYALR